MQDFEKHKANFFSFIDRIQPQEKIAIIAHANCIDGMSSVVFLIEIVKKKYPSLPDPSIYFIPYKAGTLENLEAPLKKQGIKKVCILDLNADWNIPVEFEKFRELFDVLFVDHHPLYPRLRMNEKVIKTHKDDCTALVMYRFGEGLIDYKQWSWLACVAAVSEFSYNSEDNLKFIQKYYPSFTKETRENSDILNIVHKMGSLVIYYGDDSLKAYKILVNNDTEKIEQIYKEVSQEIEKKIKDFAQNAEVQYGGKLYFYFLRSKFDIDSKLATILSLKYLGATIIVFAERYNDMLHVSTRNHAEPLLYPMNEMIRAGVKGLEGALGGGHPNASGGSFLKKDLEKFKEQIKEFVKAKIKE